MRPTGQPANGPTGIVLLWTLAAASLLLLAYEAATLVGSVWRPLLANPQALQTDFHYYYDAAVRFRSDPGRLYLPTDDVIAGFAYPPPAIVPFVWLSKWPLGTALMALTLTSYLVLIAVLQHWVRCLRRNGYAIDRATNAAVLVIAIALGPTYMNAIFGQVNAFVLASALVFATLAATAPLEAGAILAAGVWLKVYPIVMVASGIWDRRAWRALLVLLIALFAFVIVLSLIVPLDAYATFFFQVLPSRGDKTAIHVTNQSLVAFLERFRYPSARFLNWTGEQAVTVAAVTRAINGLIAIVMVAWFAVRARRGELALAASGLIALMAVVAPLGWGHTYVMALPLVMLQLAQHSQRGLGSSVVVFLSVAAMLVPAGRHLPLDRLPDWLQNIAYSRYLLATLTLMTIPVFPVGRMTESKGISPT